MEIKEGNKLSRNRLATWVVIGFQVNEALSRLENGVKVFYFKRQIYIKRTNSSPTENGDYNWLKRPIFLHIDSCIGMFLFILDNLLLEDSP